MVPVSMPIRNPKSWRLHDVTLHTEPPHSARVEVAADLSHPASVGEPWSLLPLLSLLSLLVSNPCRFETGIRMVLTPTDMRVSCPVHRGNRSRVPLSARCQRHRFVSVRYS